MGVPITEFWSFAARYGLSFDQVTLDRETYFYDPNGTGRLDTCDPLRAGRYLCDSLGDRTTSSLGYSLVFSNLNNNIRPSRGQRLVFSQDFAGLGGNVKYLKSRVDAAKYWDLGRRFIFSASVEGGYVLPLNKSPGAGIDKVRLTDRFFLGEPQMRGFDIRGVGPRVIRTPYNADGTLVTDKNQITDDAIGGRAYYQGRLELEIPLGSGAKELGLRPSVFLDAGAVFGVTTPGLFDLKPGNPALNRPILNNGARQCLPNPPPVTTPPTPQAPLFNEPAGGCPASAPLYQQTFPAFQETFAGNSARPRVSIGVGVNWNSPFGPFRIDVAKVLLKTPGDQTKTFTFNVGTQF